MNNKATSNEVFKQRIQEAMRYYFMFPVLNVEIEYRRPDLLKLSYNNSLPAAMASAVIEAYKEAIGGTDMSEYAAEAAKKKLNADDDLVKDLSQKGYQLLTDLCISHRIMNVEVSDLDNGVVSWNDIPEEDAMAFLLHLIQQAQTTRTKAGGEVSTADIETFPKGKRRTKRSASGTDGEAVRATA